MAAHPPAGRRLDAGGGGEGVGIRAGSVRVATDAPEGTAQRVGADADIAVFDPAVVADKATYENAAQYSTGFRHVLVGGTFVVREGKLQDGVAPGQPIRATR